MSQDLFTLEILFFIEKIKSYFFLNVFYTLEKMSEEQIPRKD